jgi:hypothetical protein
MPAYAAIPVRNTTMRMEIAAHLRSILSATLALVE